MFPTLLQHHMQCLESLKDIQPEIEKAGEWMVSALRNEKKVLVAGNGGSAADSQHFAAELIGRFEKERSSYPAIALTTDTSILTALGNDYGFDKIFSRQVEGLGNPGDILICISTSGNSKNLILAAETASRKGLKTIGLFGNNGGLLKDKMSLSITVQNKITARIQEAHIFILHYWAAFIESNL
jgi:D-sedoheptulose 7-phosphate isomerase